MILALGMVATTATKAYFSDSETSKGNSFAAGTLDLKIDGKDGDQVTTKYTLTNWEPGMTQMVGGFTVKNAGTVPGKYWVEIKNVVNNENGCNDPEMKVPDTSCGNTEGELGGKISGYFQENASPWNHLNPGITSIDASKDTAMIPAGGGVLAGGAEMPVVFYANWTPTANDNIAQGDSVTFDLVVHLDQVTP